ncbi:MAG: amidohydrolase family protein [Lachnospiraceae bacterium]
MEIYDFHAHIYPEKIREKAVNSLADGYTIDVHCHGSADSLLEIGRQAGINHFVTLSVATGAAHVVSVNNFILEEQKNHKEFIAFGSVHPDYPDICGELERIKKGGIKGIKIHPDSQRFKVDDERMFPFYDLLGQYGIPLLVHCGDYRFDFDNPERVARVLDEFPKLIMIAAHFGGWLLYDRAVDVLKNRNCFLDCSSSIMYVGKRRGLELIREYGAERIVFGSDYPVWNPATELDALYSLGLKDPELEMILHGNAEQILRLK